MVAVGAALLAVLVGGVQFQVGVGGGCQGVVEEGNEMAAFPQLLVDSSIHVFECISDGSTCILGSDTFCDLHC